MGRTSARAAGSFFAVALLGAAAVPAQDARDVVVGKPIVLAREGKVVEIPLTNWTPAAPSVRVPPRGKMSVDPLLQSKTQMSEARTDSGEAAVSEPPGIRPQQVDAVEEAQGAVSFSYYYVPGSVLTARDTATNIDYSGTGCVFTTSGADRILNTQLQLPDGAEIKYLRLFYNDTNASFDVLGYISRYNAGTSTNDVVSVSSSGSSGVGTALSAEICEPSPCPMPPAVGQGHIVDNFGFGYVLIGWPETSSSTVQVCGLRVAYYAPPTGTFHPLAPCRVVDTRPDTGFTGQFNGPALVANTARPINLAAGSCGIPAQAIAVSLNITVTQTQGPGDLRVYPAPGSAPLVSTLNYLAGQTIANAAVVPLGADGVTFLAAVSGTHLIVDVNGYFY